MALKAEELPMLIRERRKVIVALRMMALAGTLTRGLIYGRGVCVSLAVKLVVLLLKLAMVVDSCAWELSMVDYLPCQSS